MPYVLERNRAAIEDKMTHLAQALGLKNSGFDGALAWIRELRATLNIPNTLAPLGLTEEQCRQLAPLALQDPSASGNPIALSEHDYENLFLHALRG